jgi:hypothetical protein
MKKYVLNITLLILVFTPAFVKASDQSDVRATVQSVFEQLKARQYSALYDLLPNSSRNRMSRDRFVSALERAQDFYQLDRIEIGAVRVMGNLAVVDTALTAGLLTRFRLKERSWSSSICCARMESGASLPAIDQPCGSSWRRIPGSARASRSSSREFTSSRTTSGLSSIRSVERDDSHKDAQAELKSTSSS